MVVTFVLGLLGMLASLLVPFHVGVYILLFTLGGVLVTCAVTGMQLGRESRKGRDGKERK